MQVNKEVSITIKVDKRISDALKKVAKEKDYRFSSYVRRVLINSLQKEEKEEQK